MKPEQPRGGVVDDEATTNPGSEHSPADPYLGLEIEGRYRIERTLGAGGMGRVFLGTHLRTGASVAIKVIEPHPARSHELQTRCLKEARAMMEVRSNHVAHALDVGTLPDGGLYLVMEYLHGEDLDALLRREGPLPWSRLGPIALHLCHGLGSAHRQGIVHRDIKPSNCFRITVDDNPDHIKIIDFGIARDMDSATGPTQRGELIGTPEYLAPELVTGDARAGVKSDLYALGATLYKLLTGVAPFRGESAYQIFGKHVHAERVPPSRVAPHLEIPAAVDAIIVRALAADPAERFADTDELAQAIRTALGIRSSGISMPAAGSSDAKGRSRAATVEAGAGQGSTTETLAVREVATRAITLASTIAAFILATELVTPVEPLSRAASPTQVAAKEAPRTPARVPVATPERLESEPRAPEASPKPAEPGPGPSEVGDEVTRAIEPAPTPAPEETEQPAPKVTPTEVPAPAETKPPELQEDRTVPAPAEAKPPEPDSPPDEAEPASPPPEPAPSAKPRPEPKFPYTAARVEISQQLGYLRTTCMKAGKHVVEKLKFRVDVASDGSPNIRVYSGERDVRGCVRKALSFQFEPGPRGGAFVYTLTQTSAELVPVPPEPAKRSEP